MIGLAPLITGCGATLLISSQIFGIDRVSSFGLEQFWQELSGIYRTPDFWLWAPELHFLNEQWVAVHTTNRRRANLLVSEGLSLEGLYTESFGTNFGHRHDPERSKNSTDAQVPSSIRFLCPQQESISAD